MMAYSYPIICWGVFAALAIKTFLKSTRFQKSPAFLLGFALMWIPVQGNPLGRWLHGFTSSPSIPLMMISIHALLEIRSPTKRLPLFPVCVQGLLLGTFLYPIAAGLGVWDVYVLGWHSDVMFVSLTAITAVLVGLRNPLGSVLFASGLAWQVRLLESTNVWDYLIDPFFFAFSVAVAIRRVVEIAIKRSRSDNKQDHNEQTQLMLQRAA